MTVVLVVPGRPRGKDRPRFNKQTGHVRTTNQTRSAEARIQHAWRAAGAPDFSDTNLEVTVMVVVARPGGHYRVNGDLNAAGARQPRPARTPDVDQHLKIALDALNGLAYKDDRQVVDAHVSRRWCRPGESEHVVIRLETADDERAPATTWTAA